MSGQAVTPLLYDAYENPAVNSGGLPAQLHFFFDRTGSSRNLWENALGTDEKWIAGDKNQFGNRWYFILPSGALYAWNGKGPVPLGQVSGQLLAQLDPDAWNNIERVVGDLNPVAQPQQLITLDQQYSLFRASQDVDFYFNALGTQEKWLRGMTNSFGNDWYLLLPNNSLVEWSGKAVPGGNVLATNLPAAVYQEPYLLADEFANGSVLGYEVNLDPFGPNPGGPGDRLG